MRALAFVLLLGCTSSSSEAGPTDATAEESSEDSALMESGPIFEAEPPSEASGDVAMDAARPLDEWEALFAKKFVPSDGPYGSPAAAAYHCLATASALRRAHAGAAFDAAFAAKLESATKAAAKDLASTAKTWGGDGWGLDMAWDAFGDGSTNAADTVYAFQTGLAIWCLAEAGDVLGNSTYATLAKTANSAYREHAFVAYGMGHPIDCTSCGYFWYSRAANDVGRYVKNTNIEMAVAGLVVDRRFGDAAAKDAGEKAASSQYGEIVSYANYGYLGRYDSAYVAGKSAFDDHNSFEAYLLLRAAQLLGNASFRTAAIMHYDAYASHGSEAYVAYAACHFARVHAPAAKVCRDFITASGATNPAGVGLVMEY